jgi:hypothetical protein
MPSIAITITMSPSRKDGGTLPLANIAKVSVTKQVGTPSPQATGGPPAFTAPVAFASLNAPFTSYTLQLVDNAPDLGLVDQYNVTVTDTQGNVSAAGFAQVLLTTAMPNAPTVAAAFSP